MELTLEAVEQQVGPLTHLYPIDLAPVPGAVTVLLGATQAGKTSLMRVMAGLDAPTRGRITVDGQDVTGLPVRRRNVAMVYQQFINYPSMTVADNIASPLRMRRGSGRDDKAADARDIRAQVDAIARKLHIEPFLGRLPAELSGGQQQRVALARALAKNAPLVLLDEPLVNLDYKLREALRDELSALFATGDSTVVYATTEPAEALLLGGYTAVLDAGRLLQYGPTAELFHRPRSIQVARAFSDPPMNLLAAEPTADGVRLPGGLTLPLRWPAAAAKVGRAAAAPAVDRTDRATPGRQPAMTLGVRASALQLQPRGGSDAAHGVVLPGRVELAEISGSDTFVHVATTVGELVAQLTGVHLFPIGASITLHVSAAQVYLFDAAGDLLLAPDSATARVVT